MEKRAIAATLAGLLLAGLFSFFLIIVFLCILTTQIFLQGCIWWECVPERYFHVHELGLPESLFPDGALIEPISASSEGNGEIERGSQSFFWTYGSAGYWIKRYPSIRKAMSEYEFVVNHMTDFRTKKPWTKPENITFYSTTADNINIACGQGVQGRNCGFAGRYQEYVIYFSSNIDERMTFEDFEKILVYIDKQISYRLYP
jgi:hypothetical protein